MEEINNPDEPNNWKGRLALLFAFAFALFWSLGPFFFSTLLALSVFFGLLALIGSGAIRPFISSLFNRQPQVPQPNQSYQPHPETKVTSNALQTFRKIVRNVIIALAALFAFFFIVGIFVGQDDEPAAEATKEVIENSEPDDGTSAWNELGNATLDRKHYDSAILYYDKALAIDPQNTYALYNKGLTFTLQQDYSRANGFTRKCLRYHQDYNPAWWLLGYNYDLMYNTDSALYCLERAYSNGYNQPDFLQLVAEVYVKKNLRANAIKAYTMVLEQDSTKLDIYTKLAELDPSNADSYRRRASAIQKAH